MSLEKIEVEVKLTVAHVNTILSHLAKGAYNEVADLIAHLRGQVVPQVASAQKSANVADSSAIETDATKSETSAV